MSNRLKKHFLPITHGVVGSAIFAAIVYGGSAMIAWFSAHSFQLAGLAPRWAILIGVAVFLVVAVSVNFLSLTIVRHRKLHQPETAEIAASERVEYDKAIESRDDRISKLASEIADLEAARKGASTKIETLNDQNEAIVQKLNDRIKAFDEEKNSLAWLYAIANEQSWDISDYVVVEKVYFCYHKLTDPIPLIVFGVDIFNKSVFNITIEDAMQGEIGIAGKPLLRDKRVIYNPKISPISKASLTIEQRLSPEEADLIAKCDNDVFGSFFYFDKLIIMIGGGTQFPHFERRRLTLPNFIGSNDTPYTTEIASLKSQLDERDRQLAAPSKPEFKGQVKQVYMNLIITSDRDLLDYSVAIEVEIKNVKPKAASIQEFRLKVFTDHEQYDGRQDSAKGWDFAAAGEQYTNRISLDGVELPRTPPPSGMYEEGAIHIGWLRFVVAVHKDFVFDAGLDLKMDARKIVVIAMDARGCQMICVNEFPSSEGTRPSKMMEKAFIA
jgi:hypothetical protein